MLAGAAGAAGARPVTSHRDWHVCNYRRMIRVSSRRRISYPGAAARSTWHWHSQVTVVAAAAAAAAALSQSDSVPRIRHHQ